MVEFSSVSCGRPRFFTLATAFPLMRQHSLVVKSTDAGARPSLAGFRWRLCHLPDVAKLFNCLSFSTCEMRVMTLPIS